MMFDALRFRTAWESVTARHTRISTIIGMALTLLVTATSNNALASTVIKVGEGLPVLSVQRGGRVVLEPDGYSVAPWSGPTDLGLVQVIQYVPGTRRGGGIYDPLTERMRLELDVARYRITAIVNINVASRFAKPFVREAVVDKQRVFSLATLVLDEDGTGKQDWDLSEHAAFIITDASGTVMDAIFGEPAKRDFDRIFQTLEALLQVEHP